MYTCNSCKSQFDGEPSMVNAAGKFCITCETERKARLQHSMDMNRLAKADLCTWCGVSFDKPVSRTGTLTHICNKCDSTRSRILRCIRYGSAVSEYVSTTENREAPMRASRKKQLAEYARLRLEHPHGKTQEVAPKSEDTRIDKIEKMLLKLTEALGGL